MTMELIQHQKLTSSQSAITFSSVPATYTDLFVQVSVRSTNGDDNLYFKFNNTTSNTSWRNLLGYGSGVSSQSGTGWLAGGGVRSGTSSTFTNIGVYVPNYAGSTPKTASVDSTSEENSTTGYQFLTASLWNDTAAINRIDFYLQGGQLAAGSSVSLYGVKKFVASAAKATGGTITYDAASSSWIHTFTSSGIFTPTENLNNVEYLVIAGGGGGGNSTGVQYSSGGGAGGYRSSVIGEMSGGGATAESKISLTKNTAYGVIVGAGGAAQTQGSDSSFAGITSLGGGRGRGESFGGGYSGGSGSGGTKVSNGGGAGTAGQGYAGGWGSSSGSYSDSASGGGGGAGGIGMAYASDWFTNSPLSGGVGLQSSITGTLAWYAAGGTGAGYYFGERTNGIGGSTPNDMDGIVNTGSGGGGGRFGNGGAGASGIVIIRYKA